jgi:hypothetical protein
MYASISFALLATLITFIIGFYLPPEIIRFLINAFISANDYAMENSIPENLEVSEEERKIAGGFSFSLTVIIILALLITIWRRIFCKNECFEMSKIDKAFDAIATRARKRSETSDDEEKGYGLLS